MLALDARKPDPRPKSSHRRTLLILAGAIATLTGAAALDLPALSIFLVACFTIPVAGALIFFSALASRSAAPKLLQPIPASRVRVDADGIEAKPIGGEAWTGQADAKDVRKVYVTASEAQGFYRVRVELDEAQHRSLLDGFEEEAHAERAVAEIERVLRRPIDGE